MERKEIITKYNNGPIKNQSEDWENPQFSIYAITDYYGFIHDAGFSDVFLSKEMKIKKLDCKREIKWRKLVDNRIGSKNSKSSFASISENPFSSLSMKLNDSVYREEITKRVYKGIPQQFKSFVWQSFLDISHMKSNKPRVYQAMLKRALEKSPDVHQIDLDVNRTFRNTTYFRERYNDRQKALMHVMAAYSMYNTEIGYCQGMSEIGGLLLMYLVDEEDVFWGLSQLMTCPRWSMHGMFVDGFPRLLTFFSHLNIILQKLLPKISKHFDKLELMSSAYALKWFMQCFLDRVPFTLFLRLWDIYLLEGEKLLIAMAYNILKIHKKRIIKMDHCSVLQFLQNDLRKDFLYDDDFVVESLKMCIEELRRHKLSVPPPAQSHEVPMRPFGSDREFRAPSLTTVRQRQAGQINPEAVLRRSLKKHKSLVATETNSMNSSINNNAAVTNRKSSSRTSYDNDDDDNNNNNNHNHKVERKEIIDSSIPSHIRYRINTGQRNSQIHKSKSAHISEKVEGDRGSMKRDRSHDSRGSLRKPQDAPQIKSAPDLSAKVVYTSLRSSKRHSPPSTPLKSLQQPRVPSVRRRPIPSSPETML